MPSFIPGGTIRTTPPARAKTQPELHMALVGSNSDLSSCPERFCASHDFSHGLSRSQPNGTVCATPASNFRARIADQVQSSRVLNLPVNENRSGSTGPKVG